MKLHFKQRQYLPHSYFVVFVVIWICTLVFTTDINNWFIENTLTIASLIFLLVTFPVYRFSNVSYTFIFIFLLMHIYGAQYTYAENPLGYFIQDLFHTSRNHYDRITHFSMGFLLYIPMRELFKGWLRYPVALSGIMPVIVALSVSALYEILEWAVADLFFPEQGVAYLGTQGDMWDAQKDTFLCALGSSIGMIFAKIIKK